MRVLITVCIVCPVRIVYFQRVRGCQPYGNPGCEDSPSAEVRDPRMHREQGTSASTLHQTRTAHGHNIVLMKPTAAPSPSMLPTVVHQTRLFAHRDQHPAPWHWQSSRSSTWPSKRFAHSDHLHQLSAYSPTWSRLPRRAPVPPCGVIDRILLCDDTVQNAGSNSRYHRELSG